MTLCYVLLLGFAVSIDGFIAGISYGLKKIFISTTSLLIMGLTTTICVGLAMGIAHILGTMINTKIAIIVGALLLTAMGLFSLLQEYFTAKVQSEPANTVISSPNLTFSIGRLVIKVMAKPETADVDHSQFISPLEAILLGLALGIDNMIAIFAAALVTPLPLYTPVSMGCIQILVITFGIYVSKHFVTDQFKKKAPYLPGFILILLGLIRLWQ
jgi:putative sporulation protein YtaF